MQYETTIEFKLLINKCLHSQHIKKRKTKKALCEKNKIKKNTKYEKRKDKLN